MGKKLFKRLIDLDIEMCQLELRGEVIREQFDAMMKRKRARYSLLLKLKNNPREHGLDPEKVKKEIKELDTFLKLFSESLSAWDTIIDQKNEFYQQWTLSDLLKIENNKKRRAFLNCFPEMKEAFQNILQTMNNLIFFQILIITRFEEVVGEDNKARVITDPMPFNLN